LSDAGDLHPIDSPAARFLGQAPHVLGVTGQQDDRPRLGQCDRGEQRVQDASVPGQTGPAEQLT
jgi:hypothetical protein